MFRIHARFSGFAYTSEYTLQFLRNIPLESLRELPCTYTTRRTRRRLFDNGNHWPGLEAGWSTTCQEPYYSPVKERLGNLRGLGASGFDWRLKGRVRARGGRPFVAPHSLPPRSSSAPTSAAWPVQCHGPINLDTRYTRPSHAHAPSSAYVSPRGRDFYPPDLDSIFHPAKFGDRRLHAAFPPFPPISPDFSRFSPRGNAIIAPLSIMPVLREGCVSRTNGQDKYLLSALARVPGNFLIAAVTATPEFRRKPPRESRGKIERNDFAKMTIGVCLLLDALFEAEYIMRVLDEFLENPNLIPLNSREFEC